MSRRCHTNDYAALVERARKQISGFNITTDIIVGFPGETDAEWRQTIDFVRSTGFGHIHIFNYSPREGTKAAGMPDQVDDALKRNRSRELHELAATGKQAFMQSQLGSLATVLWENRTTAEHAMVFGYTENYTRVALVTDNSSDVSNTIGKCRPHTIDSSGAFLLASPA